MKIDIKTLLKKNAIEIWASLVLASTLFFFAPLSVFLKNAKKLNFDLGDIWYLYIFATIAAFLLLFVVCKLIKPVYPYIAVFYTVLGIGFIIQGNFINYSLGALDGREIPWESFTKRFWWDSIFWVALIAASFLFRRFLYKNITGILLILAIFQVSTSLISAISNPLPDRGNRIYFDTSREFEFSNSKNIVVVVLDTFRSEAFSAVLEKYPDFQDVFKDFTYYQDAIGGYPTTYPSIPLLLTGEFYDNSLPITEFLKQIQPQAFPVLLKDQGFVIESYSVAPFFSRIYDNAKSSIPNSYRISLVMNQYIVSGIRYAPLILKPTFVNQYYQGLDYYHKDLVKFDQGVSQTSTTGRQPVFKFFHLSGAHPPYQLDVALNRGNKGYIEQAAASLKVASDLVEELKKTGAYDNSLILILGDHGSQRPVEYRGTSLAYSAQILMLAKRVGQNFAEIQVSDAPVSLMDIPKSISEEISITNSYPGYSIFEPIPSDRSRKWFFYKWEHSDWTKEYIQPMYEFDILGPADEKSSYKLVRQYPADAISELTYPYRYTEDVISTMISNDVWRIFNANNFDYEVQDEFHWAWASGPTACVNLTVEKADRQMTLSMEAYPYLVSGQLDDQAMEVLIDQNLLATLHKDDKQEVIISAALAKKITQDGLVELCFGFPDATKSPVDYGVNNDPRLLGYRFISIILD